jgi:hypothetical protein
MMLPQSSWPLSFSFVTLLKSSIAVASPLAKTEIYNIIKDADDSTGESYNPAIGLPLTQTFKTN